MAAHSIIARDKAVRLGGTVLRADMNALCDIEDATGKTVTELFAGGTDVTLSMRDFRSVVQALGRFESPRAAGDWIQEVGFEDAAEAMAEAVQLGFGDAAGDEMGKPETGTPQTST